MNRRMTGHEFVATFPALAAALAALGEHAANAKFARAPTAPGQPSSRSPETTRPDIQTDSQRSETTPDAAGRLGDRQPEFTHETGR